jgi:hypothetical protein
MNMRDYQHYTWTQIKGPACSTRKDMGVNEQEAIQHYT